MSRFTVEEAVGFVRTVADKLGTDTLSQKVYDGNRKAGAPTSRTIIRTVGSWVDACERAGLDAGSPTPTVWTDNHVHAAIKKAAKAEGTPLLRAGYERWRAGQPDPYAYPTSAAIRNLDPQRKWVDWCCAAGVEGAHKLRSPVLSDEYLISVLKQAAKQVDGYLTEAKYAAWADAQTDRKPHQRTFPARFGTWRQALHAANLQPQRPADQLDRLDAIRQAIRDLKPNGPLRTAAYAEWARQKPERPSLSTVSRYPGGWTAAHKAATTGTKPGRSTKPGVKKTGRQRTKPVSKGQATGKRT